jgi:hypothetical protein
MQNTNFIRTIKCFLPEESALTTSIRENHLPLRESGTPIRGNQRDLLRIILP